MKEFKGSNKARIVINASTWENVKALRRCFAQELLKQDIDIDNLTSLTELKDKLQGVALLNVIKNIVCSLECSEEFDRVLCKCLADCTYKDIEITENLFDDIPEAREDYDVIRIECIKENLKPFFKKVAGMLNIQDITKDNNQSQK